MEPAALEDAVVIVAILTPHSGAMDIFRAYETRAAAVMARHGGVIERTVVEEPPEPEKPFREIHVVTFPNSDAFQRYCADPDLAALADLRAASIAHTVLFVGREGPDYMALSKGVNRESAAGTA